MEPQEEWLTPPEILKRMGLTSKAQLNLEQLYRSRLVARRLTTIDDRNDHTARYNSVWEYRYDQYLRWYRAKEANEAVRAQLRLENERGRS